MNLYIRLIITIIKILFFKKRIPWLGTSKLSFMVWPWDCDINIHLNNARFLSFMDQARVMWAAEVGALRPYLKHKYQGVLGGSEMTFVRPLPPFTRFHINTKILCWTDDYTYVEQRFISKKGLHAIAIVKVVILSKGRKLPTKKAMQVAGVEETSPVMPEAVTHWRKMSEMKKHL